MSTTSVDRRGPPSAPLFTGTGRARGRKKERFLEFRQPAMPAKLFVWHGSKAGHSSGVADVDARRRRPRSDADALGARWLSPAGPPAIPLLSLTKIRVLNPARVAQGQRSLNRCSGRDFQHEVFAPTATAAFHSQTVAAGMLLQQRPTRRVLSYATAKLLRDEAESMVPNIDPEQVRKLAAGG